MIHEILAALAGYLVGSISPGVVAGRGRGIDLRALGSGGTGFTNAVRHLGWRAGLLVLVLDVGKGALAAGAGVVAGGARGGSVAMVAAVCGHLWPIFAGFRGGKGVAVTVGALAALWPAVALSCIAVHAAVMLVSGYVSLGSMVAAASLPLLLKLGGSAPDAWIYGTCITGLVLWAHRGNVLRLLRGTEPRWGRSRSRLGG